MTIQTVKESLKRKMNSKLWCSDTLPIYSVITCMGLGYYTTTIHVTTTWVNLYLSYLFLTPKRSFVKKQYSILGVKRYAWAKISAVNAPKYPISKLSLITRNLNNTVH